MINSLTLTQELNVIFSKLLNEYSSQVSHFSLSRKEAQKNIAPALNAKEEKKSVDEFLTMGCGCKNSCYMLFSSEELLANRAKVASYTASEKNCYLLGQLQACSRSSEWTQHSNLTSLRKHQTFEYRINIDRPVCRQTFLFYYGETIKRLKRLQKHFLNSGNQPPIHGNAGRKPACSYGDHHLEAVENFILNLAECHGMPDPGRDVRRGKGRLRILLPSIMNYTSVHELYVESVNMANGEFVGYDTFVKIWQNKVPYITFNNPKTDLCLICENFKKQLSKSASILDEDKEAMQEKLYQEALAHLKQVQKERLYYKARIEAAQKHYSQLGVAVGQTASKANSKDIAMHYSWDFAQQLQYPFEDQQAGPIYFKIPRRAQVFGVCCEGIPRQVNYLIDEADFTEKNANTVISLLDHFFAHHGLGEKIAYLTADNCVGQNKNNALLQYLAYRVLASLHTRIELSFLIVGHTKFSPDGYFGLIKHRYRRSKVYTYEQLGEVIEASSKNGHNVYQPYRNKLINRPEIVYRDWVSWLAQYFNPIPRITKYHHFQLDINGSVNVKETVDSKNVNIMLLKKGYAVTDRQKLFMGFPDELFPRGLTAERQWYLYDQIRMHIPNMRDQDATCPKPCIAKPKKASDSNCN